MAVKANSVKNKNNGKNVSIKKNVNSKIKTRSKTEDNGLKTEIISIIFIGLSLLFLLSLFTENGAGFLGGFLNKSFIGFFGIGAYLLPFLTIFICIISIFIKERKINKPRIVLSILLFFVIISFLHTLSHVSELVYSNFGEYVQQSFNLGSYKNGGLFGALIGDFFIKLISKPGTFILLGTACTILIILLTGKSLFEVLIKLRNNAGTYIENRRNYYDDEYEDEEYEEEFEYEDEADIKKSRQAFNHTIAKQKNNDKKVDLINDFLRTGKKSSTNITNHLDEEEEENKKLAFLSEKIRNEEMQDIPINGLSVESIIPQEEEEPDFVLKVSGMGIVDEEDFEEENIEPVTPVLPPEFINSNITVKEESDLQNTLNNIFLEDDLEIVPPTSKLESATPDVSNQKNLIKIDGVYQPRPYIPEEYEFPPLSMLNENDTVSSVSSRTKIYENSKKLEETLKSFGVEARVVEVSKGPTVTRYELSPGPGVKVSKISGLADDLALSLAAVGIRIEAPVPGKSVVGIEIPNKEVQPVFLKEVIDDDIFRDYPSKLAFALGKDISGHTIVADIAKMPHLLIAGATGSGKSVCINTLITSIIYKSRPDEVKLLLIDPKVVELSIYNGIPHLLIPVVTDPKKAAGALNWAVVEMTTRYKLFAEAAVRDLKGYNSWLIENGVKDILPQIVIVIDELADLMMAAPGDVEEAICRIAQMARAAGLHLIIATQRPSVDVITGLIKANVPSRLAFAVSSGTDSRTILDSIGAEKLLGKGDMLFNPVGLGKPQRIQGAFISDKEVEGIVKFLKENAGVEYDPTMVEKITSNVKGANITERDELLEEAVDFIMEKEKASVSMLQRRFRVGYNRAARLMEEIEARGVVGPEDGSKPRKIYMSRLEWKEYKDNYLK